MRQAIWWTVALLVLFPSASCRRPSSPKAATAPAKTYRTPDGLQITPVEAEQNELADVLGVKWWRFRVASSYPDRAIRCGVELRKKGESPRELATANLWSRNLKDGPMLVALCPIDGEITSANRLKIYLSVAGAATSSIRENPFKGCSGYSSSPVSSAQTDDSLTLLELAQGHDGSFPDPNNPLLVLTLHVGENMDGSRP